MNNNIGKFIFWFYAIFFGFPIILAFSGEIITSINESGMNPIDYARITEVDYKGIVIDEPGEGSKLLVTETLTFDIHAASKDNLFWELWRDLPEDYVDGVKIDYKVNSVKQIDENGRYITYDESSKLYWYDSDYTSEIYGPEKWYHSKGPYDGEYNYECLMFYVDGIYRDKITFEIEYEVNNPALRYGDVSELYVPMYSGNTIKFLDSFKAEILLQDKDMPKRNNYEAYTYGTNSHEFPFEESKTKNPGYHTFIIDLNKDELKFKPYNQYIEFTLWSYNEDKHIFTNNAPHNSYYYDNNVLPELRQEKLEHDNILINGQRNKLIIFAVSTALSILFLILALKKEKKIKNNNKFFSPSQEILYYRDIPSDLDPYVAANLVFSKRKKNADDGDGYSAILLSLVRKKYVELERIDPSQPWNNNNIKIRIKYIKPNTKLNIPNSVPSITIPTMAGTDMNSAMHKYDHPVITDSTGTLNKDTKTQVQTPVDEPRYNVDGIKLEALSMNEASYYNLLQKHCYGDVITMTKFNERIAHDYNTTTSFVKSFENSIIRVCANKNYIQKGDYKQHLKALNKSGNTHIIFGILVMIFGNIISYQTPTELAYGAFFLLGFVLILLGIYLKKHSNKYTLLTQIGEDEYEKWYGLYNFLNSSTLMSERTVIELPLWEKYLVYATAFGISDKVIQALEIRCPDFTPSPMLKNNYYRSSSFRISNRSFRTSTRAASSHSYSSSSYGGYSGGRGGGGGGGGH